MTRTDYYGRELVLDENGDVIPTIWLGDVRFRRYASFIRSPVKEIELVKERLDDLVNKHLYSPVDEHGGRTLNPDPLELKHILAGIAQEVENLKKVDLSSLQYRLDDVELQSKINKCPECERVLMETQAKLREIENEYQKQLTLRYEEAWQAIQKARARCK